MTNFTKSNLVVAGDDVNLSFVFTKVDKDKRTVTGIATADNPDLEDDIVDYGASKEAFEKWVGNIREMHGSKAVGRSVSSKEITVTDDAGNTYKGFEVTAYISKGANDTWEKILDGTLKGFSIGGRVVEKVREFHKASGKTYSRIKKYILTELSVVDNPANPLAQFTMIKNLGGEVEVSDILTDSETIYYCDTDEIAKTGDSICSICNDQMQEIGSIESIDDFTPEAVTKMIEGYDLSKSTATSDSLQNNNNYAKVEYMENIDLSQSQKEGLMAKFANWLFSSNGTSVSNGVTYTTTTTNGLKLIPFVADNTVEKSQTAVEADAEAETKEEVMEKNETVTDESKAPEAVAPALDLTAIAEVITKAVNDALVTKAAEAPVAGSPTAVENDHGWSMRVQEVFGGQLKDLHNYVEEVAKGLDTKLSALDERLTALESAGAVRKSVDVTEDEDEKPVLKKSKSEESVWGNIFVPQNVIEALGYEK